MRDANPRIAAYADHIMIQIADDIAAGIVPPGVGSFADLHRYLDANDYLDDADVPYHDDQQAIDLIVDVQDEVSRRLREPCRPFCTHGHCTFSGHDHTTIEVDGQNPEVEVPMRCAGCDQPAHHDSRLGDHRHDDPSVPDCRHIRRDEQPTQSTEPVK